MSGIQGVVDSVSAGVQRVVDAAKGLLGIASPSRVFMEIGDYSMQGLALGFEQGERPAARSVRDSLESLMSYAGVARLAPAYEGASAGAPTYNVYVNGARVNDWPEIQQATKEYLVRLKRLADI